MKPWMWILMIAAAAVVAFLIGVLYRKKVAETTDYKAPLKYGLGNALRTVVSHKAGIDWTSGSHTALPVMTTATGAGAKTLSGFYENSELGRRLRAFYE